MSAAQPTPAPRVVLCIASLVPEHGGPSRSITGLAGGLAADGLDTHVLSLDYGARFAAPVLPADPRVQVHQPPCPGGWRQSLRWTPAFAEQLTALVGTRGDSIVHDNGVWLGNNAQAARVARRCGRPLVISPRGMLGRWALAQSRWKKRLAWWLFQRAALHQAAVLHATSAQEAAEFRALGLRAPVAIVPNGVDLPALPARPQRPPGAPRVALFLSRVHPKKGLPRLLEAWAALRPSGWMLRIAGPDDGGHAAEVRAQAARLGIAAAVQLVGAVDGAARWTEYRAADLFVLPSYNENFGLVIAEAMAMELPVLTTTSTPWEALRTERAGWWVEPDLEALQGALRDALQAPPDRLAAMGARGAAHVRATFTHERVAARMAMVYRWLLGQGARPDCVQVEY